MGGDSQVGSGVEGLDEVLHGGFRRGQVHLIRGASGTGKTTLCLQYLMEGARSGESALYIGTAETQPEIRSMARSHGWSLDGIELHHHEPMAVTPQTVLHPVELELPQTLDSLLEVFERVKPQRLVIDSLAEIRSLARDSLWYRHQLTQLKARFQQRDCTVLLVEIPAEQPTLNSMVSSVIELEQVSRRYGPDRRYLRVLKSRGQPFSSGLHDCAIRRGGIHVFPRLTAAEYRRPIDRESIGTGLPELDAMFRGNLLRGTSMLLLGTSGTGKSLLTTQLAVASAERGDPVAMYVFDERVQTVLQRAAGTGLPLGRWVEKGTIEIRQVDPTELTTGEFGHLARRQVMERGIRMLIIDSLNGYAYAMPDEQSLTLHLHELLSFLSQQSVTPVCTMIQHGLLAPGEQAFDVSYIADAVLLLRHFEFGGQMHKAISLYKLRTGDHATSIHELYVGPDGLRVGPELRQFQGILGGTPEFVGTNLIGYEDAGRAADDRDRD